MIVERTVRGVSRLPATARAEHFGRRQKYREMDERTFDNNS
jgi:hypothetical protein